MADEAKNVEKEKEPTAPKRSPIKLIVGGIVVILLLGGGGFFFLKKESPPKKGTEEEAVSHPEPEHEGAKPEHEDAKPLHGGEGAGKGPITIYDMDPFVVNLADTPEFRYLKVNVKLDLVKPEFSKEISDQIPQIRDSLLILLSSKRYADIRTVEGKMELRDEILHRVNAVFKDKKVKMAYFTDFVAQ